MEDIMGTINARMISIIPPNYKIAFRNRNRIGMVIEMIPEDETLDAWTEMLTVHIMHNVNEHTLDSFYKGMKQAWKEMCAGGGASRIVERGVENQQPTLIWSQACPLNPQTGRPENTWFKLSIRSGVIVVVQKAFRFEPSADDIAFWLEFLGKFQVTSRGDTVQ
ncbi:hypothetical protein QBD01_001499 [Ochrobactrum sp. 19YEA23]|uniref:hypothetical protein n=1 Tax=Ochrobactrum sp. 19YEA23 TaxID=3039854 RepID=UPI0024795E2E|nr:hypothetical protein [Ochrobactrum sp. 19YEA23]